MDANTTGNEHPAVMLAKVLMAKIRLLGSGLSKYLDGRFWPTIERVMSVIYHAESETGMAQMDLHRYIDKLVRTYEPQYSDNGEIEIYRFTRSLSSSDDASLPRCSDWRVAPHGRSEYSWESSNEHHVEEGLARLIPRRPDEYLGFAVSFGMIFYLRERLKCLPNGLPAHWLDYLLRCAVGYGHLDDRLSSIPLVRGTLEVIGLLLKRGANPNFPLFGATVWSRFLALLFHIKHDRRFVREDFEQYISREYEEDSWRERVQTFISCGADIMGVLSVRPVFDQRGVQVRNVKSHQQAMQAHYPEVSDLVGCGANYAPHTDMSVTTVVRFCLGGSLASSDIHRGLILAGAEPMCKCVKLQVGVKRGVECDMHGQGISTLDPAWTLSCGDFGRFLEAYTKGMVPSTRPSNAVFCELECEILKLCFDFLRKNPSRKAAFDGWRTSSACDACPAPMSP